MEKQMILSGVPFLYSRLTDVQNVYEFNYSEIHDLHNAMVLYDNDKAWDFVNLRFLKMGELTFNIAWISLSHNHVKIFNLQFTKCFSLARWNQFPK